MRFVRENREYGKARRSERSRKTVENERYKGAQKYRTKRRGDRGSIFPPLILIALLILGCGAVFHSLSEQRTLTDGTFSLMPEGEYSREHPDGDVPEDPEYPQARGEAWKQVNSDDLDGSVPQISVDLTQLYSPYAILVDFESGKILAGREAQSKIYPASLTKIMTAVLAVENTEDMEETVTVPENIFPQLYAEDASTAGFLPGERARLWDLLYGILLPSGAECCLTFAERIAGSEEDFVEMMNRKAEELGLAGTHFCNATGLHDPEHYSTVEDIAALLRYALQSAVFRTAFTGSRYSVVPSQQHPDGFTFASTMFSCMENAEVAGGRILGGKTGYTEEAGQCLASLAEIGGREYILVTAKAPGTHETEQFHILDAQNVYNQIGMDSGTGEFDGEEGYWWER